MSTLIGLFVVRLTDGPAQLVTKQGATLMHHNVEIARTIWPVELEREFSCLPHE